MPLLLAIDVGNTQITLGIFSSGKLLHTWRLQTHRQRTADELGIQLAQLLAAASLDPRQLSGVVIASVVPPLDAALREAVRKYLGKKPLVVSSRIKLGIKNLYKKPEEVGADRLVNAVAVHSLFKAAVIVVDFGTATTFDCVSSRGDYLGGVIAPGLEMAADALASRTAKLPKVTFEIPARALGKTTVDSIESGLFWGYVGLVDKILIQLKREMGGQPKVVATGGLSVVIGPRVKAISKILPDLTLQGLRLIWDLNK
jgi:type III pantothenate kinase